MKLTTTALDAQREASITATAFDNLLAQYREMSDSERAKGNYFEELTCHYLLNDPEMSGQFEAMYLGRDLPCRPDQPDTGIDLVVAIDREDMPTDGIVTAAAPAVAVQCKCYAPGKRLQQHDVDSFLSASGKEPFKRRIYVDTTGAQWGSNAEKTIQDQTKQITRISLADFRNPDIAWPTYQMKKPEGNCSSGRGAKRKRGRRPAMNKASYKPLWKFLVDKEEWIKTSATKPSFHRHRWPSSTT